MMILPLLYTTKIVTKYNDIVTVDSLIVINQRSIGDQDAIHGITDI